MTNPEEIKKVQEVANRAQEAFQVMTQANSVGNIAANNQGS